MAEFICIKFEASDYTSESKMIREVFCTLLARHQMVEILLHEQMAPAFNALQAAASGAVSMDEVRVALSAEHTSFRIRRASHAKN